ncbi:MAG TPA: hypothetical protein VNN80_00750 [Polyangiaceae bacterium]|jgi:hypothetical protein|nr:hypothetical protein [Polyangiaceae bacterium]
MLSNTRILLLGCLIGLFQASAAVGLLTLPASAAPGSGEVVAELHCGPH